MVGSRIVLAGAFTAAFSLATERAKACSVVPPPPALVGAPADGDRNVPTDVVPVYSTLDARLFDYGPLTDTVVALTSSAGTAVAVTMELTYSHHVELFPETELEPSTEYTLRMTVPYPANGQTNVTLNLSFTTGEGPLTVLPDLPDPKMQHYHSTDTSVTSCDPGERGSCIFFAPGAGVEVTFKQSSSGTRYLTFGSWWTDLTGIDQGTPDSCATLRARAADGRMSGPVDICRAESTTFTVPDLTGLECTENGFAINGVPLAGAGGGGPSGGTGGTATGGANTGGIGAGGAETGGTDSGGTSAGGAESGGGGTGGNGNSAGAPDEPDDDGSRTVLTEGCGCRVASSTSGDRTMSLLAAAVSLLLLRRRRA